MKKKYSVLTAIFLIISSSYPSFSQTMDNEATMSRMERIERDMMLIQRQLARSGGGTVGSGGAVATGGGADFEVRLSSIEEQMREILGRTEEVDFQVRKLSQNLEKLQKDTDFRFNDLTQSPQGAGAAHLTPTTTPTPQNTLDNKQRKIPDENLKAAEIEQSKLVKPTAKLPDDNQDSQEADNSDGGDIEKNFSTPRDHYNYAFRLLNQTQYDKSALSFADFIKKHPKDPLIGNAYYWQGEIFYIRRDYVKSADSFRQGFEELPTGSKAPDNLLKLAMSLNALKRSKEACVVLGQVVAKFKATSAAVAQKAEQEQKRIDCK